MAPNKIAENDMASNSNATSPVGVEKIDLSKAVAASLNNAQADPSHVKRKPVPDLQKVLKVSRMPQKIVEDQTPARRSLADRIHDLSLKVCSELPALNLPQGDTYVYLDPPTQQPEQDDATYANYTERYKTPMLLKKETLLSFNSPFFENIFGSTYQYRIRRRRGLVGNLPEHVKYVIDLTPPSEGDEAVYLMTELCCSDGVRKWFLANQRWAISKSMIGGEDDYMLSPQDSELFTSKLPTSGAWTDGVGYIPSPGFLNSQGVLAPLPMEYSPVRHRSGIERVLVAMQGLDPQLDSAPKVWTTFAVAKYFALTHSPLNDYIVRWLRAFPNSYFLEVNPEISLKIADGLQCHDLCRDIFAILVGEEALATTRRNNNPAFGTRATVYGRKRDDLLESYQTRIEYASKAFIEQVFAEFSFLVDKDMSWLDSVPEFSKLVSDCPRSVDAAICISSVKEELKSYVRGAIYNLLSTNFRNMPDADQARFGNDQLFPNKSWELIWKSLQSRERLLTRSFWEALRHCYIFSGPTNLDIQFGWDMFCHLNEPNFGTTTLDHAEIINIEDVKIMVAELNYNWSTSIVEEAPLDQIGSLSNNLPPDDSGTSSHPAADAKLESGSGDGETRPPGFANGPIRRVSPDGALKPVLDSAQLITSHCVQETNFYAPSIADGAGKKHFDLLVFFSEAMVSLRDYATRMLAPPDAAMRAGSLELRLTNTLVNLTDAEWKFLPLWAGGNDDGSGGVFNDDVPLSHGGYSSTGPNVCTDSGSSLGTSEAAFGGVRSLNDTITNTSLQTNDGSSDTSPQGKVGSADEGGFSAGHNVSVHDGEHLSSDQSIVFVPSINGSSITIDSDYTIITPSETQNDEGEEEKRATELVRVMELDESVNAPSKGKGTLLNVEESEESFDSDDTFDFNHDYDSDTMDGDFDDDDDEDLIVLV